MAPVKVVFSDHSAAPPVFVAGSFTEWQPIEIKAQESEEGHVYEKTFDLAPGTYQYKFRLGPGDWWVCDAKTPLTRDSAGNENNEIVVAAEPVQPSSSAAVTPVFNSTSTAEVSTAPKSANENVGAQYYREAVDPKPVSKAEIVPSLPTSVAKTEESSVEEKQPAKVNGITLESSLPPKDDGAIETPQVAEDKPVAPENEKAGAASTPEQNTKQTKSEETSISSLPSKEKASGKQQAKPEKLGWFTRIFLCGSSRQ